MGVNRFEDWVAAEEAAEAIIPLVGRLYRSGVVVLVHGASLVHASPIDIVKTFKQGHLTGGLDHDCRMALEGLGALAELGLAPAEIDLGKLLAQWNEADGDASFADWLVQRVATLPRQTAKPEPTDVVLYGFGRIGRIMARLLVAEQGSGDKYRLRAIVVRKRREDDLDRRVNLLRRDSIHGPFNGTVQALPEENAILMNGQTVKLLYANSPEELDYTAHGIDNAVVIDNTGKWRDREGLSLHLTAKGASKVLLTAPGKGDVPNIVYGVNHTDLPADETVISAASCTTNAITIVLKAVNDAFGIESGHLETVHAFTNDQNLIDNYHPKDRRGRSAALNMVITSTGAASAVAKALPELKGKLTGSAIRVPTPDVSLAVLNLRLGKSVTADEVNSHLREVATSSELKHLVGWTANPDIVSSDLVGDSHAGVVDATATVAHDNHTVLYVWYDNEWGYSVQVLRLLEHVIGVRRPSFP